MFNLDQAIAEWRRRMLAAGIKTPVPLDELEAHLRDEIEQQAKSGLSEAEAFQVAVEEIGKAHPLQQEFKKVEKGHKIIRAIVLVFGWLAASCALAYSVVFWDFDWNFWSFSPEWNLKLIWAMLGVLVADAAIWFLAKASREKASRAVSLMFCVILAGFAVVWLRADERATGVFGGAREVPLWWRGWRTLLLCVPSVFWVWWRRRHSAQKRGSTRGSRPIHLD
jgi:hypothetical protein